MYMCSSCNSQINPTALNPKDQELSCSKCENLFHKKCTNRKKTTANWRKTPWYCASCILGTQTVLGMSQNSPPSADPLQPLGHTPGHSVLHFQPYSPTGATVSHLNLTAGSFLSQPSVSHLPGLYNHQQARVEPVPTQGLPLTVGVPGTLPPSQPSDNARPTFPNASSRQRSSNVNVSNAEQEFLRTALNACRSTIAQQESEMRKQKEGLDIRNKRIMQLEDQVGYSSEYIAGRDTSKDVTENGLKTVIDKLDRIEHKLSIIPAHQPANNIVINSCKSDQTHIKEQISVNTQTDQPCNPCENQASSADTLSEHVNTEHVDSPAASNSL